MSAQETLARITACGVVAIVRTASADHAREQGRRVLAAGQPVLEVSLTTPDAVTVIRELATEHPDAVVGAGTVLDAASAEAVIEAGAQILVSPVLEPAVVAVGVRHDVAVLPGCLTPTEMTTAMHLGATAVKIFPAHLWSPAGLAGLLQALPDLPCVPTGGVGIDDATAWIEAGAVALGVGTTLTGADDPALALAALQSAIAKARERA
jgi:2-dehydro-3-deoxyphosphogluconate aldolase/(4S)-4-hydroxy-2-oxoglutarate aldolase